MDVIARRQTLRGHIQVPGSKSHTIRALILATMAEGRSRIRNPLPSADCMSTAAAIPLIGAEIGLDLRTEGENGTMWSVNGAGKNLHAPTDVINVGNSGSLLYFLAPIAATFDGWSVFTGDASIRTRPVRHMVDAINQMGARAFVTQPQSNVCPMIVKGPTAKAHKIVTEGNVSSQYISGLMLAALRLSEPLEIELTDPKETPYLTMTKTWLERVGAEVAISADFRHISVAAPRTITAFDCTIPSDWEAVAFPLVAALLTDSTVTIDNIDGSGTQGDEAIVPILQSIGADITWDKTANQLTAHGGKKARNGIGRLSTQNLPGGELHVALSPFPDAICVLAVIACFTEGTTVLEDAAVCRRKETDRIALMAQQLSWLGADVTEAGDSLIIRGHSPVREDGMDNPAFRLHGGTVESHGDHRIAMSLACLGLGLRGDEQITVHGAECCDVSFPHFFDVMTDIGAKFKKR